MATRAPSKKKVAAKKKAAPKPTITKPVKEPSTKGAYTALFEVNEKEFKAQGDTPMAAITSLVESVPPLMFKTKAFLILRFGKKESSQLFFAIQFRRLQGGKVSKEIWAKRLEAKLK